MVSIQVAPSMECVGILEHGLGRGERGVKIEEATHALLWTLSVDVLMADAGQGQGGPVYSRSCQCQH